MSFNLILNTIHLNRNKDACDEKVYSLKDFKCSDYVELKKSVDDFRSGRIVA